MRITPRLSLVPFLFALAGAVAAEEPNSKDVTRNMLLERQLDLPATRLNTRVLRLILPEGFATPLHTHEAPGPRYVVRGQMKLEAAGESKVYGPGEVFWETGEWMKVENVGQGEVELVVIQLTSPR